MILIEELHNIGVCMDRVGVSLRIDLDYLRFTLFVWMHIYLKVSAYEGAHGRPASPTFVERLFVDYDSDLLEPLFVAIDVVVQCTVDRSVSTRVKGVLVEVAYEKNIYLGFG